MAKTAESSQGHSSGIIRLQRMEEQENVEERQSWGLPPFSENMVKEQEEQKQASDNMHKLSFAISGSEQESALRMSQDPDIQAILAN